MNVCIVCGCTDLAACVSVDGEPCSWVIDTPDGPVCSACVLTPIAVVSERLPLAPPLPFRLVEEITHECGLCGGDGCAACGGLGWAVEAAA